MKDFAGTPGTLTGLILRIVQCLFAAGSIASMATRKSFFNITAFCYLIASMGLQVIWSFGLASLDAYALARKKIPHNRVSVSLFVVGDWVTATLSLSAAASSAGVTVLYFNDMGSCSFGEECTKFQMAVALAFLSWITTAISSIIMFLLLAAAERIIAQNYNFSVDFGKSIRHSDCKKRCLRVHYAFGFCIHCIRRFQPYILMVLAQIGYTFLYFITEASFDHGMNPHVYITYRHIVAGLVMLPFAYFLERKIRPKLTLALFLEIFVLSLLGVGLTLNMYFASLRFTSPTFLASMVNTIASLTFVLAVILRLEVIDLRNPRGIAKVLGTLVSLAGVMTMTLYKGAILKNPWRPIVHLRGNTVIQENWLKGSILTVASCLTWSIWYIMQAYTLKRYPAQLSLTTWMSFVGAAQSAVYAVIVQHKRAAWTIGFNIDFWSTIYGGVVISGIVIFIQLWCTEQKGPVFVTMFNPLSTLLVAVLAYFALGEKLCIGSIVGGIIVIFGLYLLLWGKENDQGTQMNPDEESIRQQEPKKENCVSEANYVKAP
ncbi:hypothetical protein ACH5RR_031483 [Cinchona calisaya]|uniref:WAT1-related protein n=1 Tax=Cinchona calisaya TaxID=153742 RepID=A0ABD2YGQ5_9GENT